MKRMLFVVSLLLVGMTGLLELSAMAQARDTLITAVAAGPVSMNPQAATEDANYSVVNNIFDALLQRDCTGNLEPSLATSWEKVDLVTWRFYLRKGVKFHNGNDFTWEDVKFTFERLKNHEVSEFSWMGGMTKSVQMADGDPWVVDIEINQPVSYYIQNVPQIWIMDKESTEARSIGDVGRHPIGTGPYQFVEWMKGSYVSMTANEDYWGAPPPIRNIVQKTITEASTRVAALLTGEVDLIKNVPLEQYDGLTKNSSVTMVMRPGRRAMFLGLRNSPGFPTSDVRVRQAIEMAINVPELIERILYGHGTSASQVADPPTVGYNPDIKRLPYDPEKAKQLLAEAGYADGFTIKLSAPNDRYASGVEVCEAIASYLAKVGITVNLDLMPKAIFWPQRQIHNLEASFLGWFDGAYSFGRTYTANFHTVNAEKSYGGSNGCEMSYPLVDSLMDEAQGITDPQLFSQWIQLANKLFIENVGVVPLYHSDQIYGLNKGSNLAFDTRPDTWLVYKEIRFK